MPSIALSRSNFPFLTRTDWRTSIQWNHGELYSSLLSTSFVRVSERGIWWCVTCQLATDSFWAHVPERLPCLPAHDVLCQVPGSANRSSVMRLFPSTQVRVPPELRVLSTPDASTNLGKLWAVVANGCQGAEASRSVVFGNFNYDVSLCDLVHSQLDFVFYPRLNQVSWRERKHAVWNSVVVTVLLSCIVLFLFTRVCANLANMIRRMDRVFDWYTFSTMLLVVCASFEACRHNDFVAEEKWLTLCLQVYSLLNLCVLFCIQNKQSCIQMCVCVYSCRTYYKAVREWQTFDQPITSSDTEHHPQSCNTTGTLVCVLLVLTAHMQNTYDTPFLTIFVLVFGARSFLKFLNLALGHAPTAAGMLVAWKFVGLCADTVIFGVILELGVRTSMDSENQYNNNAAALQLLSCLGGVFLYLVIN
jgi:hypothetical protein